MSTSPREQMILTTIRLFQRGGYAATSWRKLVQESGAPWGSARHYFPGGKEQLGVEAIGVAARAVARLMDAGFANDVSAADGVRALFATTAAQFRRSGYCAGCPVATVALETTPASKAISKACADALTLWRDTIEKNLARCSVAGAKEMASTILSLYEGSLIVARVTRSPDPLNEAAEAAGRLLDNA